MKQSLFFIKYEARNHAGEIFGTIRATGLVIKYVETADMTLPIMKGLYGHVLPEIFEKLCKQLLNKSCIAGVVEGDDAVKRLVEVIGTCIAPSQCDPKSLRFKFGNHTPGFEHENVAHRPKTDEEARQNILLFDFPTD